MTKKFAVQYLNESQWQQMRGEILIDLASPQIGESAVDLGCGTGRLTKQLAQRVGRSGQIIAIDPDESRLDIAKHDLDETCDQIDFILGTSDKLSVVENGTVDLIYSNYVVHWIEDKSALFDHVRRCLKEDGRLVFELVGELPKFLEQVSKLAGQSGEALLDQFHCLSYSEWTELIRKNDLVIEHIDWLKLEYKFDDLTQFFDWWEATTHGAFQRSMISEPSMQALEVDYPKGVQFSGYSFQGIVYKR
ncbi:hypothetical protein BA953_01025 [Vibrio coralliilyticus]|uniref:class I SAM-dependent methyltransferase n=1 Tax=Vibrio coralliilyticus TaxID=190893 RepID=UPI000810B2EA|nr:class I SAM-dependent methyltransferase [Vibrio coralliilyticus]ANW22895.1 hypothetical protein BA953_01025 [Vibrio coralliilyticus]